MSFVILQDIFIGDFPGITVTECDDDAVTTQKLKHLWDTGNDSVLGVSATYGERCQLSSIAFATLSQVLVVNIPPKHIPLPNAKAVRQRISGGRSIIQDHLLLDSKRPKYAFGMGRVVTALYLDLSLRIVNAADALSVSIRGKGTLQAILDALGGEATLQKENVRTLFFSEPSKNNAVSRVALKAWAACRAATLPSMSPRFSSLPRINTKAFPKAHLEVLARIARDAERLEALKPTSVKNDVEDRFTYKKGSVNLVCSRFPTRLRTSANQVLQIEVEGKGTTTKLTGRARKVEGRSARVTVQGPVQGDRILSITTLGKELPTLAESAREDIILNTLQGTTTLLSNPFFQSLWLPGERPVWPVANGLQPNTPVNFPGRRLNPSQDVAVRKILSTADEDRMVLIQGPPGTGKTTVIAAAVISHDNANSNRSIWIAAQSNVAVKNIAEKFLKEGFDQFRILVSKDFHFDWHEHLYEQLEARLIRSDRFKMSIVEASRLLLDCKVILCTLSMFSNLHIDLFIQIIPVEVVILDEASQIESGDYLPVLHRFHSTLSKMVFIGDDKQLPPYGQEDIAGLRSVFEFPHLRKRSLFLDTQYRMPHIIGRFISENVYGGKLATQHSFTTSMACRFIDVNKGREYTKGHSWMNREEARVVVKLAHLYELKNWSYRIITPYDAQRSLIESHLKSERLHWEDKVFNVDSFQGNEDDHIIISVVRSRKTGFLKNQRRTNVMLTRCKQSMVICSSRAFLFGEASKTLVGKLAASLDAANWIDSNVDLRHVLKLAY